MLIKCYRHHVVIFAVFYTVNWCDKLLSGLRVHHERISAENCGFPVLSFILLYVIVVVISILLFTSEHCAALHESCCV